MHKGEKFMELGDGNNSWKLKNMEELALSNIN
jgi:hypothetical protein